MYLRVFMADDLQEFVLTYFDEVGALVERPAFGVADVLLPDDVAGRLGVEPLLRLGFSEEASAPYPDARHLTVGDTLVERIEEDVRGRGRATRWFINEVGVDKRNLFEAIKQAVTVANGWLQAEKTANEAPQRHYYVRFNFKVALITDDKQEELVSVLMDLNSGQPAWELEATWERVFLERAWRLRPLPEAPLAWAPTLEESARLGVQSPESRALTQQTPDSASTDSRSLSPLSPDSLARLQARAAEAVTVKLAPTIRGLEQRSARRLELDRARLQAFYDDTAADLERRMSRTEDEARRHALAEKLAFVNAERANKLADVEAKYRLRLVLDLINAALIVQPKLSLAVRVENRYASIQYPFIWDPLLHHVEPPVCHGCGEAHYRIHLCTNGHLACDDCVLTCDFCKREFCKLCERDVGACIVCGRAVCIKSQVRCATCGRVTCSEHAGQCH